MPEPTTRRHYPTDDAGIIAHLRAMAASFLGYAQARTQLAGIESREAVGHYLKILIALVVALILALTGYLFLCLGIVFAIARLFQNPNAWIWVALAVALAHFAGVGICALLARRWIKVPVFSATIEEFKKDQEWLTKKTN
jgi:uncharacterized membrane protein YqjE